MRRPRVGRVQGAALAVALLSWAAAARADIDIKFGGVISSDIRYRLNGEAVPPTFPSQYQLLKYGFSRNENLIKSQLQVRIADKVKAVGDVDLYMYGYSDVNSIDGLTLHENVDPYRVEVNAAYLDIYRLLPGLDLRIGRQVVVWGSADKFNPTNNINSLDFSDPLLFGKALANNMVRVDYNPIGDWTFTGVLVPIFRPSQLPRTAPVALLDPFRPLAAQTDALAQQVYFLGTTLDRPDIINTYTMVPEPSLSNLQWGLKLAGRILDQDVSLSWYHGRFSFPVPATALFHLPASSGMPSTVDIGVAWPRMDVLGADLGGTIPKLGGMGYWIEAALIFPQAVDYAIYSDIGGGNRNEVRILPGGFCSFPVDNQGTNLQPATGPGCTPAPPRVQINSSTPFLKLTIGGDWSIGSHVYLNVQYVHGFFDEFGDGWTFRPSPRPRDLDQTDIYKQRRIGDYAVGGLDFKFLSDTLLLRIFGIVKLPSMYFEGGVKFDDYHATGMLFPQIAYQVWDGTELSLGAFVFFGDRTTKFGDPATGASELFLKAKFTY